MASSIPKFSELPIDKNGPHHNAWGLYGKDDQLGTLNRLTDDVVKSAASEIQTGTRINLDWPLDAQADVPFFGRQSFEKNVYQKPPRIVNDDVWTFNTQSSSQWDGLRHFGYQKEAAFYNGVTLDEIHGRNGVEKTNKNGIGAWAEQGIVGRGVLLDYHEWRLKNGIEHNAFETGSIPAVTLKQVAKDQGTEIKFGDILILRTGYLVAYNKMSKDEIEVMRGKQPLTFTGVEQSEEMMEFMWSNFSACAADHPSWEAWPTQKEYALHEVMLAGWGMPIGELFDLEKLAAHCKNAGRYSFFVVSKPVNVPGGVASPPNIVAIF
ncbi:putative kynurenine formamidase/cyclase, kynurenine formamidase superfamily [Septoria linicola]|nr:putative kynurenine formamidase/cyclase, kynurenine formamidase superfamily [Septoria linicola]